MASVWKRLQRVNKRAAKFQYTASYHRIDLETSPKWKPNKLSVVWTRRSRRVVTEAAQWEPSLKDPLKGSVIYTTPENHTVAVTLFKDSRNELEDKDWTFVLEDVSPTGKRRRLAVCAINMRAHASLEPAQRSLVLRLEPTTAKVIGATLHLTLHCVLLREGQATDEDMQSLASLLSVNNNTDIAVLEDLDEDDYTLSDQSTRQMLDLRQQMEEMTQSLTGSDIAATPNSVQSLKFDNSRTPTAPHTPHTPHTPDTPTNAVETSYSGENEGSPKRPDFLSNLTKMVKEPPRFASTPNKNAPTIVAAEPKIDTTLRGVVFKPTHIVKRNLKPLELKTNLNSIGLDRNDNECERDGDSAPEPVPHALERDKTPVQDLLEWCQAATGEQRVVRVTNLTTAFRSGLAFCAIIHRYRPDLIDFSGLQPDDPESCVRAALEASAQLGISQVLSVGDVCRSQPDRLAIMTYLFQLRAHFTGNELQVEQLGESETESSYLVGRHDTDGSLPAELFSREVVTRRSQRQPAPPAIPSSASQEPQESRTSAGSPVARDVRELLRSQSKAILGKVLSPKEKKEEKATAKWFGDPIKVAEPIPARPEILMTRKELTDPFGSDDEEEPPPVVQPPTPEDTRNNRDIAHLDPSPLVVSEAPTDPLLNPVPPDKLKEPELPKPTPQLLSRHDELKERARLLLEATKREAREKEKHSRRQKEKEDSGKIEVNGLKNGDLSPKKPSPTEDRQALLRERARRLIASARAGVPAQPQRHRAPPVEIISKQSVLEEIAAAGGAEQLDAMLRSDSLRSTPSRHSPASPDRSDPASEDECRPTSPSQAPAARRSPLQSFSAILDRLTPDKDHMDESAPSLTNEADASPDGKEEGGSYIASELLALEREQRAVDERAKALERQLRQVMERTDDNDEEARLMSQWFNLVNKKNALLRRQMQLNILEQEEDLSRRCELLARELRLSLAVDEWRKTPGQKRRELLLLQDLLSAVNERDRLVQEMDEQERAIADDDEIERNLSQVDIQRKNNCILQ